MYSASTPFPQEIPAGKVGPTHRLRTTAPSLSFTMSGETFPFRSRFPQPYLKARHCSSLLSLDCRDMSEARGVHATGVCSRCGRPHYCLPYQTRTYFSISQRLCLGDGHRSAHRANCATADTSLQREVHVLEDLNENPIPPALARHLERTLKDSLSGLVQRPARTHPRRRLSLAQRRCC